MATDDLCVGACSSKGQRDTDAKSALSVRWAGLSHHPIAPATATARASPAASRFSPCDSFAFLQCPHVTLTDEKPSLRVSKRTWQRSGEGG